MTEPALSKWDLRFLDLARFISTWSKDPSTQVGAVLVDRFNRIISAGFNGLPRGIADSESRLADRDTKLRLTLHAEDNALNFAAHDTRGATCYVWPMPPCGPCAARLIQSGVVRVVAPEPTPDLASRWGTDHWIAREALLEAGVEVRLVRGVHDGRG